MLLLKILIINSDASLLHVYHNFLESEGFDTITAASAKEAWCIWENEHIDLIITSLNLPNMEGHHLIGAFRDQNPELPILVLSDESDLLSKNMAFSAGADDYLCQSVPPKETLLHIRALLRRCHVSNCHRLNFSHGWMDYDTLTLSVNGTTQRLPLKEFTLLFKLLSYPGKVFSRLELLDELWGKDSLTVPQTVDVHVNRLRSKLKNNPDFQILTVRGIGYKAELTR